MAEAAVEAFAGFAVGAAQLYECLGGERVAAFHACFGKKACDAVAFGGQLFEQCRGGVLHGVVAETGAIGVEQRHHEVYDQYVGAGAAECPGELSV